MNYEYRESRWAIWQANLDDEYLQKNLMHGASEFALYRFIQHISS